MQSLTCIVSWYFAFVALMKREGITQEKKKFSLDEVSNYRCPSYHVGRRFCVKATVGKRSPYHLFTASWTMNFRGVLFPAGKSSDSVLVLEEEGWLLDCTFVILRPVKELAELATVKHIELSSAICDSCSQHWVLVTGMGAICSYLQTERTAFWLAHSIHLVLKSQSPIRFHTHDVKDISPLHLGCHLFFKLICLAKHTNQLTLASDLSHLDSAWPNYKIEMTLFPCTVAIDLSNFEQTEDCDPLTSIDPEECKETSHAHSDSAYRCMAGR